MSEETRLLHALRNSGISRVAVVDDAFDLPEIDDGEWGTVRAHLLTATFIDAIKKKDHIQGLYDATLAAIEGNDLDSDDLVQFFKLLFDEFIDTGEAVFDPGHQFSVARGASLQGVKPILELLRRANSGLRITRIGSIEGDNFAELIADIDLVFADFFLDPLFTATNQPDDAIAQEAKRKSQHMIQAIITARGKVPSIVLMSSKDVAARATAFRKDLGASYVAARFQFVEKNHLRVEDDGTIRVEEPASDTLLDILQTFRFGEGLSLAVEFWQRSAREAIAATAEAISELEIRDFAYLIRFRLEKEGQDLIEYMEWLLGEYLTDETARRFYSLVNEDPSVRTVAEAQQSVEGAYDGQSQPVANIYHRVRVEEPRIGRAPSLRMGDLFLSSDAQRIAAVITPDCDLVLREGKRRAKRLTVVNGRIKPFDRKNTSAAEFIIIDNAAKNIEWSKKDIETHDFAWADDRAQRRPLGTLRPMYAQQLQRAVVHDFGRVGLAPWPALYINADVELWYLDNDRQSKRIAIPTGTPKTCVVMPRRPDSTDEEKHIAIFPRSMMRKVRELLAALDPATVVTDGSGPIAELGDVEADIGLAAACRGVPMETMLNHNILVTQGDTPGPGGWCWLFVRVN